MAVKTYYLGSGQDGNFGALFDGVAQTAASRADGWTVAKIASTNASDFDAATKQASGTFAAASSKPSALITSATANAFKTPAALTGTFANTAWTFSFAVRATTASSQAGRMKLRVYKSVNASGASATEITSAAQTGTTSATLSTSADGTTTVTWSPGATIDLNNEYLFFVIAWEITTASGSNSGDVVLRTGSTGPAGTRLVTPNFVLNTPITLAATTTLTPALVKKQSASRVISSTPALTAALRKGKSISLNRSFVFTGGKPVPPAPGPYSDRIISLSPLAYYRFGEPSGTTANDSSGNGRHATYVGSPALGQPGPFGSNTAVLLDGVDDRITVPSSVVIPAGSSVTFEWWGKVNTADLTDAKIFEFGSGTSPDAITGYAPWSDAVAYWDYGDAASGSGRVSTYYNSCLNKWALFHYTFDATTGRHSISINGLEIVAAINANAPTISSAGGVIGCGADLNWKFKGTIDEFVIYDKALTPAQRIATYRTAFPDTAPVTDYVNRWDAQWPSVIVQHPWGGPTGWQWWGNASGNDDFRMEGGQFNGYYVPEYAKYQLGGIDVPSFDGTDNEYSTWNRPTMPVTQTWFVVGQIDATTGVVNLVSCGRFGPSFYLNDGKPVWGDHWNVDPVFTHPNSVVVNKPFIAVFGYDGSTASLRLDGVQATASFSRGSWTPDAAFLTGAPPAGQTLRIGEIVMFDRVLSASEVSAVEAWLSAKWLMPPVDADMMAFVPSKARQFNAGLTLTPALAKLSRLSWTIAATSTLTPTLARKVLGFRTFAATSVLVPALARKLFANRTVAVSTPIVPGLVKNFRIARAFVGNITFTPGLSWQKTDAPPGNNTPVQISVTTILIPAMVKGQKLSKSVAANVVLVPGVGKLLKLSQSLSATVTFIPVLARKLSSLRAFAASTVISPIMSKFVQGNRTFSVTATLAPVLSRRLSAYRAFAASGVLAPTLSARVAAARLLGASTTILAAMTKGLVTRKTQNASVTLIGGISYLSGKGRVLAASVVLIPTMKRLVGKMLATVVTLVPGMKRNSTRGLAVVVTLIPDQQRSAHSYRIFASVATLQVTLDRQQKRGISLAVPVPLIAAMGIRKTAQVLITANVIFSAAVDYLYRKVERLAKPIASLFSTTVDEAQLLGAAEEIPVLVSVEGVGNGEVLFTAASGEKSELLGAGSDTPSLRSVS